MPDLPKRYRFLLDEPGPRLLVEALKLYGVAETPGPRSNPIIMGWAEEVGADLDARYLSDLTPWCGLFMAVVAKRAEWPVVDTPLWARSWAGFGAPAEPPMLGDVLVFRRDGGGHVALYVGEDRTAFHVLGGNQGDRVSIARWPRANLVAARRPVWRVAAPPNRRRITLTPTGPVTTDGA